MADRTTHTPEPDAWDGRVSSFRRGRLSFAVTDTGPTDGPVAVLLHGWPGGSDTWRAVVPLLNERGVRTLVPDQRGYSPGARPNGRRAYVVDELVGDVLALLDEAGLDDAHLVGHDWGGAVAWALGSRFPDRVASLTVLSTPHPAALARALWSSDQALRSSYAVGFQVPLVPERLLLARDATLLRTVLERSGLDHERAVDYCRRMQEPGALTASLAWYRAVPFSRDGGTGDVAVPTSYVWSTGDAALGRRAAELTADHVTGPYRFQVLDGVSHWIPEQEPGVTAEVVVDSVAGLAEGPDAPVS